MTAPVQTLTRVTTEYHSVEDRVRLSGQLGDGTVTVIWMTGNLLGRLVPELIRWLEAAGQNVPRAAVFHSFKQERARSQLEQQLPVKAADATSTWLATAVDLRKSPTGVRLVFRNPEQAQQLALDLAPVPLRQWLNMLLQAYTRAQWSLAVWPEWMREQQAAMATPAPQALH